MTDTNERSHQAVDLVRKSDGPGGAWNAPGPWPRPTKEDRAVTNDSPQVDPMREARQRVLAARNNLIAIAFGELDPTVTMTGTIALLDQAAVWLDGTAE